MEAPFRLSFVALRRVAVCAQFLLPEWSDVLYVHSWRRMQTRLIAKLRQGESVTLSGVVEIIATELNSTTHNATVTLRTMPRSASPSPSLSKTRTTSRTPSKTPSSTKSPSKTAKPSRTPSKSKTPSRSGTKPGKVAPVTS
jgi:hypothetical protein